MAEGRHDRSQDVGIARFVFHCRVIGWILEIFTPVAGLVFRRDVRMLGHQFQTFRRRATAITMPAAPAYISHVIRRSNVCKALGQLVDFCNSHGGSWWRLMPRIV
jgi:hypothetical protein